MHRLLLSVHHVQSCCILRQRKVDVANTGTQRLVCLLTVKSGPTASECCATHCTGPAAQQVGFRAFGGITSQDPIGARHALALTVLAARKVMPSSKPCQTLHVYTTDWALKVSQPSVQLLQQQTCFWHGCYAPVDRQTRVTFCHTGGIRMHSIIEEVQAVQE